jgi:SagB-type dehydrogenase family enzyme
MAEHIGEEFLKKTRFEYLEPSGQMKGLPRPPLELEYDEAAALIDLPARDRIELPQMDLTKAIGRRVSVREYAGEPLTLEELSYLLWCTQGVKKVHPGAATLRTVPSAGARHALETYLLINSVDPLSAGLYRFLPIEHKLLNLREGSELADEAVDACLGQGFVKTCAAVFIWTAVVERMTWRYGERGYRYLFLDAGHVGQNLYLSAEAIDAGICAIGAFDDEKCNRLVDLDGRSEFVIYLATVGKKRVS